MILVRVETRDHSDQRPILSQVEFMEQFSPGSCARLKLTQPISAWGVDEFTHGIADLPVHFSGIFGIAGNRGGYPLGKKGTQPYRECCRQRGSLSIERA